MRMPVIFILLPAYNEGENILSLLEETAKEASAFFSGQDGPYPVHAVVVNDGSHDDTHAKAASFTGPIACTVIDHQKNRGLAQALKTGIAFILEQAAEDDVVITLDADGTHKPMYMFQLSQKLEEGFDMVVASRYAEGGKEIGVSGFRLVLSRGARVCYRLFFPRVPLRDFSCGFRGIRLSVLRKSVEAWGDDLFQMPGFACTGELMLKTLAFTTMERVTEIPFELHYEQKGGSSKMPAMKTILGTLQLLWKARRWIR
jgi:dolichol-phosphate mannosyltransferase